MKRLELKNIIKESITDYLSERNTVNENDPAVPSDSTGMALDMMKNGLPTQTGTGPLREEKTTFEDKVTKDGNIYLVKKATKDMSEGGIIETVTLEELLDGNIIGGNEYVGAYLNLNQALAAGKKALKQRDSELKENVKKGHEKVGGLEKQVADLKAEMAKLIDNPEMRGELSNYTAKLEKAEQVLEKLKAALEKSSPKKEKKEKKDDE
jgi:regulator of replication initiation timing